MDTQHLLDQREEFEGKVKDMTNEEIWAYVLLRQYILVNEDGLGYYNHFVEQILILKKVLWERMKVS